MRFQDQIEPEEPVTKTLITTTLYDLIAALNVDVDQDEDELITAAVVHLIKAGRLTFRGNPNFSQPVWV